MLRLNKSHLFPGREGEVLSEWKGAGTVGWQGTLHNGLAEDMASLTHFVLLPRGWMARADSL